MRFRQVEAFRAAMLTGSVTGAANFLGVSQPSASRLIADLETSIGFKLFDRSGGRLVPTPEGMEFYQAVDRAFVGMQKLERAADQIREARTRVLTVCALPVLASSVMPHAIRMFLERHPHVMVNQEVLHPPEILESLQAGQLDLAMSVTFAELPGVVQEPLITPRFICALPKGHPLTAKEVISLTDFHDQDFIGLLPSVPLDWSRIDRLFEERGIRPRRRAATPHSHAGYAMVAAGVGIGLFEPFAAHSWIANGVEVRPLDEEIRYTYSLCLPGNRSNAPLTGAFVTCLKATLRDRPPALNTAEALH